MKQKSFKDALKTGEVLVSDGATGTNYQARGLLLGSAPENWLFEEPAKVIQLHRDFVAAGSNVILTNTFGGTGLRLAHSGLSYTAQEVNQRAVELAKEARNGSNVWIAGSMGPTGKLLEPLGELTREEAIATFGEQARALEAAGADLLVIETQFDLGEAAAAIEAARAQTSLPIVCSFSFDMGAHTMMGLEPAPVARELTKLGVDVIGVNCGKSLEDNLRVLVAMREVTNLPIWMKPNAGLPHMADGDVAVYDVTPEAMGEQAVKWVGAGAQIIGGCCGTSPDHLHQIASAKARVNAGPA